MVQEFYVLKCHSCELFQVHIVKKAKKWNCKVCGQKQSVVKIFGQGSAKDCRMHVQKLNAQRDRNLQNLNEKYDQVDSCDESETPANNYDDSSFKDVEENDDSEPQPDRTTSKWQKYLEPDEADESSNDTKFQKRSSSNLLKLVQSSEVDEPVSKKFRVSGEESTMKKKVDVDSINLSSEVFHLSANNDGEVQDVIDESDSDSIDDMLNFLDELDALDQLDTLNYILNM